MTLSRTFFYSVILGISFNNTCFAENNSVREINSIEMDVLAHQAAKGNKQLMIVYYKNKCKVCDYLTNDENLDSESVSGLKQNFAVYKSDVSAGFNVTCPNGEEFNENEFMAIKGISKLPAIVITDSYGNVTVVENNIASGKQLIALGEKLQNRSVAGKNLNK